MSLSSLHSRRIQIALLGSLLVSIILSFLWSARDIDRSWPQAELQKVAFDEIATSTINTSSLNTVVNTRKDDIATTSRHTVDDPGTTKNNDIQQLPPPSPSRQQQEQIVLMAERSDGLASNETYIRDSIERIFHSPQHASIQIQLSANSSSCQNPYLIGRLSGPHLAMIKWQPPRPDGIITGTYHVPKAGRYFVEILGLLCQTLKFEDDFKDTCLERPETGRLTAESAYIDVVKTTELAGYWQWSNGSLPITPLQTRFQPQNCRWEPDKSSERCTVPRNLDRFQPYRFIWKNTDAEMTLRNHNSAKHHHHICLIGSSHSRKMRTEFKSWLDHFNITNVKLTHFDNRLPSTMNEKRMKDWVVGGNCTRSLVAVGQWSAAYPKRPPTNFKVFQNHMIGLVNKFQKRGLELYLRNIHYNPLGDVKLQCPPRDWRSPPVIDMYNDILQNISASMNVSYIDGTSILSTVWDSAADWCHYINEGSAQEALHILSRLLSGTDGGGGTSVA
jgi:hypothetical protein